MLVSHAASRHLIHLPIWRYISIRGILVQALMLQANFRKGSLSRNEICQNGSLFCGKPNEIGMSSSKVMLQGFLNSMGAGNLFKVCIFQSYFYLP